MSNMNYEELTLDGEVFENARANFDLLFQRLLKNMEKNNSDEGSITLKVDLQMVEDFVPDDNGDSQKILKPIIKHKITTAVPVKDSFDGKKDTGMNLVWDDELKRYVLKYISIGGQRSIFDSDYEENMHEGTVVDEDHALPGPSNILPNPEDAIYVDAEDIKDEAENGEIQADESVDEEVTAESGENTPQDDTEVTDTSEEDFEDYGYNDPEEW